MNAEGKFIDVGTLAAEIEDADFGIGDTTVEAGLGIWLKVDVELASQSAAAYRCFSGSKNKTECPAHKEHRVRNPTESALTHLVLAVAITSCWTTCHFVDSISDHALPANGVYD